MEHIKQTIISLLTAFFIIFSASCKKYKQTDKPLYDVLISHTWQPEGDDIYYHFNPDSSFCYNLDINNDTSYNFDNADVYTKWWIEYEDEVPCLHIKNIEAYHFEEGGITDTVEINDSIYKYYKIDKYNDYRIVAKSLFKYPDNYDPRLIPDEEETSEKVVFNAVN